METKQIKQAIRDKFAWPGGYTIVLLADDGAPICTDCGRKEYANICYSTRNNLRDGWQIVGVFLLEGDKEHEGDCVCSHCSRDIWDI